MTSRSSWACGVLHYERNVRISVLRSQRIIAEFVKVNKGRENPLDGDSVLRRVGDVMLQQEHQETREEQVAQLRTFAHPLAEAERLVSVRWSDDGPVVRALPDQSVAECNPSSP